MFFLSSSSILRLSQWHFLKRNLYLGWLYRNTIKGKVVRKPGMLGYGRRKEEWSQGGLAHIVITIVGRFKVEEMG